MAAEQTEIYRFAVSGEVQRGGSEAGLLAGSERVVAIRPNSLGSVAGNEPQSGRHLPLSIFARRSGQACGGGMKSRRSRARARAQDLASCVPTLALPGRLAATEQARFCSQVDSVSFARPKDSRWRGAKASHAAQSCPAPVLTGSAAIIATRAPRADSRARRFGAFYLAAVDDSRGH
jgi:hypothetical protein